MKRQIPIYEVFLGALVAAVMLLVLFKGDRREAPPADSDPAPRGVAVLAYHYLREGSAPERIGRAIGTVLLNLPLIPANDYWTVSSGTFERHLRYLRDNGYRTITLGQLIAYMKDGAPLPGRCVAITFDDGDESVYRFAYPLLRRYGMVGTVFVVTGHVGESWSGLALSGWDELKAMKDSGVMELGSHTHDLHYKTERRGILKPTFAATDTAVGSPGAAVVLADLRRSLLMVEQITGEPSVCLAWPFGFGSALADSLAREAGYEGIVTMRAGVNKPGDSPFWIKRYTVTSQTTMRSFRAMIPPNSP